MDSSDETMLRHCFDEIPVDKIDEVDDNYFDNHLMDNTETAPTPKKAKGTKNKKSPLKKSPKDNLHLVRVILLQLMKGNHLMRRPMMTVMTIKQSIFGIQAGCGISQLMNVKQ